MSHRLHLFKAKIHRATVTHADLDYEGSVTISGELLDASGILEHEQVHIWNVTRGTRLVTYALRGDADSGIICINGAAAHLANPGDKVIIAAFAEVEAEAAAGWKPTAKPFFTAIVTFADLGGGKTRYRAVARHWTEAAKQQHEAMGFHEGWKQCALQLEELAKTL